MKQNVDKFVIQEEQSFKIDPLLVFEEGEHIDLIIKEYPTKSTKEKVMYHIRVNAGVYKTSNDLLEQGI